MTPHPSARGSSAQAYSYAMFPVAEGAVDLRADGLPSCASLGGTSGLSSMHALETYEDPRGLPALRKLLARRLGVSAKDVLITNGASEAIALTLLSTLDVGQRVALPRPCFPAYEQLARLFGFRIDPYVVGRPLSAHCLSHIRHGNLLVLVEPHNPTGIVDFTDRRREASRDAWIVTDLSHSGSLFSGATRHRLGPSDLMIGSLSKVLRLPGLRVGFLVAQDPDLLRVAAATKTHLSMATSTLAQSFAVSVLSDESIEERIRRQQTELEAARQSVRRAIDRSASLRAIGGEGGSHLLVESDIDADEDALWGRLSTAGVVGLPGRIFHSPYPCVRLCYGQPAVTVATAAERLARC